MWIDLIAVIILIYGLYVGYTRGIIKTVFSVVSVFIGILAALKLSPIMISLLEKLFNIHPGINFLLGFGLTFLLVMMGVRFLGKKIEDVLELAKVNIINKSAGGAVMGMLFLVVFSYILYGTDKLNLLSENAKQRSVSYGFLSTLPQKTEATFVKIKPLFEGFYTKVNETFKQIKEYEKTEKTTN
ncbi:MAG: CvpA family protein [Deltaproteobacteria bacterium]